MSINDAPLKALPQTVKSKAKTSTVKSKAKTSKVQGDIPMKLVK